MLPRRCLFLPLLASLLAAVASLDTTLTVDLSDSEAVNATRTAPPVCSITFLHPDGYAIRNQTCEPPVMNNSCTLTARERDSLNAVFTKETSTDITFSITFNSTMTATCNEPIPNQLFVKDGSTLVQCSPVFSCDFDGETSIEETVQWWRFATLAVRDGFLNATHKSVFVDQHLVTTMDEEPKFKVNEDADELTIFFNVSQYDVVGYYATTFRLNDKQDVNAQSFTVYSNPTSPDSSGDKELIFGTDEAKNFRKIFCRFVSFPAAIISWEGGRNDFTTEDTGDALAIGSEEQPTLSLGGRLVFEEVQYEDGGTYRCTARHPLSGEEESETLRLRVRNPLRPLWPAIGILVSFILTFLFISGGALVDKLRGKRASDDDDGSFQRNYSIVSNLGDDQGSSDSRRNRKHKPAEKRISITQQELLANASDPN